MNILLVTDLYPTYKEDKETSKALHVFTKQWNKTEDVFVIKTIFLPIEFFSTNRNEIEGGFSFEGVAGYIAKLLKIPKSYHCISSLKHITEKRNSQVSVIISHMPQNHIIAQIEAARVKKPLIIGVHMSEIRVHESSSFFNIMYKRELVNVYKDCSEIVCRSDAVKNRFLKIFPQLSHKTSIIPSGVDEEKILLEKDFVNKNLILKKRSLVKLITVARLIPLKNIHDVLESLSRLDKSFSWEYTIVGEGREEEKLRNLVENLNLSTKVNFTGNVSNEKVFEYMRESDVFVMVSAPETMGLVYLEAMASGCLVIGAKMWGIDGIIKDKVNGFLIEVKDRSHLVEVFRYIMDENNKNAVSEILKKSYETIKHYTNEKVSQSYLDIIKKVSINAS